MPGQRRAGGCSSSPTPATGQAGIVIGNPRKKNGCLLQGATRVSSQKPLANSSISLPRWEQEFHWARKIGEGTWAVVFRIGPTHAAKFYKGSYGVRRIDWVIRRLRRELDIMYGLHEAGVAVAKPVGVFGIKLRAFPSGVLFRRRGAALVMEYLNGAPIKKRAASEPERQRKCELEKAAAAGFDSCDVHRGNALWVAEKHRTYLVDFQKWRKKSAETDPDG